MPRYSMGNGYIYPIIRERYILLLVRGRITYPNLSLIWPRSNISENDAPRLPYQGGYLFAFKFIRLLSVRYGTDGANPRFPDRPRGRT